MSQTDKKNEWKIFISSTIDKITWYSDKENCITLTRRREFEIIWNKSEKLCSTAEGSQTQNHVRGRVGKCLRVPQFQVKMALRAAFYQAQSKDVA